MPLPATRGELIDCQRAGFLTSPKYFQWELPGARDEILLRPHVVEKLQQAEKKLPNPLRFLLWDGFRCLETQQFLYDDLFTRWRALFPLLSEEKIRKKMVGFVAVPSDNPDSPSPHITGSAIDMTLFDTKTGMPLEMGTDFDDFTDAAFSDYFITHTPENIVEERAKNSRLLLKNIMTSVGFLENKKEWWHFEIS